MSRGNLAWLFAVPAVTLLSLALAYSGPARERDRDYHMMRLVGEALAEIDREYVRELDTDARAKLIEDMLNGGLTQLDPYSGYFNEKETKQLDKQIQGKFSGIGITLGIDRETGRPMVLSPIIDSPAYKADVRAGDLILKVDGKATDALKTEDLMTLIQGEANTWVTLTVLHSGDQQPADCRIQRQEIVVPSVLPDVPQGGPLEERDYFVDKDKSVAYVRLLGFSRHAGDDLAKVIAGVTAKGGRGVVLDMRDNPGGLLQQAVAVTDLFLNEGLIVSIRDRRDERDRYEAGRRAVLLPATRHPVAVLINRSSASASEIVAAALQDHGRGVVVGERSYGKGSVQTEFRIPRGDPIGVLKLTTATWWRPSGKNLHRHPDAKEADEWGVRPSPGFEVPLSDEERTQYLLYRRDRDIVRRPGAALPQGPVKPFVDKALEKAVEHVRAEVRRADG